MILYKLWEKSITDDEIKSALCNTEITGRRCFRRIAKSWARSYVSERPYFYKMDKTYYNICMGFDIETTRDPDTETSYMYIWQLSINTVVILGRYWAELFDILDRIKAILNPRENDRLICWIHNFSHEFAYMKRYIKYNEDYFFTGERTPIYVTHDNFIQFRDSMQMGGGCSLAKLAKDYCTTQKAVGDLDYEKPRNKSDAARMTETEYGYCINDVVILAEYATYYWRTYLAKHFCPVTSSSVLRAEIKSGMTQNDIDFIKGAYPEQELYTYLTRRVYRGGYVHANINSAGELYTVKNKISGYDITSSYPFTMLAQYGPGKFIRWDDLTIEQYEDIIKTQCVIATFEFLNLRNTTSHSIESVSKCLNAEEILHDEKHTILDNGRILAARHVITALTELDYLNYKDFYTWSAVSLKYVYVAPRMRLPHYLVNSMLKYYRKKSELKAAGLPYAIEKAKVNTYYGVTVTRHTIEETHVDENGNTTLVNNYDYNKAIKGASLLPQWGVYISAHARRNLLECVKWVENVGEENAKRGRPAQHVLYCDTDSIKVLNSNNQIDEIIAEINAEKRTQARAGLDYYGANGAGIMSDKPGETIGEFEREFDCLEYFKTLGAKRYCYTYKGKFKSTIAGLPKTALLDYYNFKRKIHRLDNIYDLFDDGLIIPDCKLGSIYYDEPTQAVINGELMREESSVCLTPVSFSLSLAEDFTQLIDTMNALKGKEYREG